MSQYLSICFALRPLQSLPDTPILAHDTYDGRRNYRSRRELAGAAIVIAATLVNVAQT